MVTFRRSGAPTCGSAVDRQRRGTDTAEAAEATAAEVEGAIAECDAVRRGDEHMVTADRAHMRWHGDATRTSRLALLTTRAAAAQRPDPPTAAVAACMVATAGNSAKGADDSIAQCDFLRTLRRAN